MIIFCNNSNIIHYINWISQIHVHTEIICIWNDIKRHIVFKKYVPVPDSQLEKGADSCTEVYVEDGLIHRGSRGWPWSPDFTEKC